jgi:hypothetical protein
LVDDDQAGFFDFPDSSLRAGLDAGRLFAVPTSHWNILAFLPAYNSNSGFFRVQHMFMEEGAGKLTNPAAGAFQGVSV